jgi:serine protease Do
MISNIFRRPKPPKATSPLDIRRNDTIHHYGTLLQVDTRLSIGTSGGALLNLKGELIGITTSLAALSGYESSAGYAVPLDEAIRRIVKTLAKGLEVEYGYLGISPQDFSPDGPGILPAALKRQHAAMASIVHPRSPAERGGLRAGDVILDISGRPVHDQYDLMRIVGLLPPGSRVPVHLWRDGAGRELRLTVTLGKWPAINDEEIVATAQRYPAWRGMRVDHPTGRRKFLQLPYRYYRAVVVLGVDNPALKKSGELQPGDYITDVNGQAVETPAEFHAAAGKLKGPVRLRLLNGSTVTVPE